MHHAIPLIPAICLATGVLSVSATLAAGQGAPEFRWEKALPAGSRVRIRNVSGNVSVSPSSTGKVEVVGIKTGNSHYFDQIRAEATETADGVVICVLWTDDDSSCDDRGYNHDGGHDHWGRADMDLQVKVPATDNVEASSVNGDVSIAGTQGDIRASSVSGSVRLDHVRAASIAAHSVSGNIDASIDALTSAGDLTFRTVSGSVTLGLPKDLNANLSVSTVSGRLDSDFSMTLSGGMSRRRIEARIGKGGRQLDVGTVSGSVRLRATT